MQAAIQTIDELEEVLSRPDPALITFMRDLTGDLAVIGAGGKMGPSLVRMAARADREARVSRRIVAVSSFSRPGLCESLEDDGVVTHRANLLEADAVNGLPQAENVIYMVGRKFGSTGAEWSTWATNVLIAGRVAERYKASRIVAFSSGNVYPFVRVDSGGATEATTPEPVGEYAMSCLGRERMFDYASNEAGARVVHFRLNYAVELRYGIVLDVATRIWKSQPINLTTGYVNMVWQGYANSVALRCLEMAAAPPAVVNVTGMECVSIRALAMKLGEVMGIAPIFTGKEAPTALLSNATQCHARFGPPDIDAKTLVPWVAHWVMSGGATLDKPTHFETRDGKY